jgi:hypothetical protein
LLTWPIFHLSIRPISRAKGQSAVAQVAYDTRGKLTNKRTDGKHDWSKHKNDLIEWQIMGPHAAWRTCCPRRTGREASG